MFMSIFKASLRGYLLLGIIACGDQLPLSGGALPGEPVDAPVSWVGVAGDDIIQLETQGEGPYSVNLWTVLVDDDLHVFAGDNYANWVEHIEGNAFVRLQAENFVYALKAERVTDPGHFEQFAQAWESKYGNRPRNESVQETYLFRLTNR
jgi:hypothetical protein